MFAGVGIMGALLAARGTLPGVFTSDAAVVHQVKLVSARAGWGGCGKVLGAALAGRPSPLPCRARAGAGAACFKYLVLHSVAAAASAAARWVLNIPPRPPLQVLPLIAAFMPLDAAASVMDGVLLGSQEAGWLGEWWTPACESGAGGACVGVCPASYPSG